VNCSGGALSLAGVDPFSSGPWQPGEHNAITDVPGVLVGQVGSAEPPYLTGTTVVHLPGTAVAGVDVRGGAPGTRETDLLKPMNSNPGINAIVLTGGSAFGLDTAGGVMAVLAERGEGVRVGELPNEVVPIVPAAVIFDLGRGGDFTARPDADWGRRAIEAAAGGPVAVGNVGAGTGARASVLKGGVGTASVRFDDGTTVGALAVVNAAGSALAPDGTLVAARYGLGEEFAGLAVPTEPVPQPPAPPRPGTNTTIAVVATDVPLDKTATARMALVAHDGLARAIEPTHTLVDGDTVFAVSAADPEAARLSVLRSTADPAALWQLERVYAAAARTLARAIVRGLLAAESVDTRDGRLLSYRDTFPSAFR
jgi:L-aminopeptidase/D-esterase-like protein